MGDHPSIDHWAHEDAEAREYFGDGCDCDRRTQQDADNALLVRALADDEAAFVNVHNHGICLTVSAERGQKGRREAILFVNIQRHPDGGLVFKDSLRAALRRALGEE